MNRCTNALKKSNFWIQEFLNDIEDASLYSVSSNMSLETKIWEQMEAASLISFGSDGFKKALFVIKNLSKEHVDPTAQTCSEVPECVEMVRKIILQLTMIKWGILGLGDASPGK